MAHHSILDTAGTFSEDHDAQRPASDWRDYGTTQSEAEGPGGAPLRRWNLSWNPGTADQARAVRDHYAANAHGTFDLEVPGAGAVSVFYDGPPRLSRLTARSYSISVQVTEAYARSY